MSRPPLLLLVHRIPYPPDKGDKIRSWNLLQYLATQYDVHLGCFVDDPEDWQHTEFLESLCAKCCFIDMNPKVAKLVGGVKSLLTGVPMSFTIYQNAKMARFVEQTRTLNPVAELVFSSSMAPYIEKNHGVPRYIDMVDADSAKWAAYAADASGPMSWVYKREAALLGAAEAQMTRWADRTFLITPEEGAIVKNHPQADASKVDWWMNGVDTEYFDPAAPFEAIATPADIVFAGAMDYGANIDATKWFVANIWPRLKMDTPALTFAIVGARPSTEVLAMAEIEGITVTGRVADMRPWLQQAKVVIAPLRIARGVQNKVLEAMAMGKAIVATPDAAAGIDQAIDQETLLLGRDEAGFAAAVQCLLADQYRAETLGKAARLAAVEHYPWRARLRRLGAYLPPSQD